MTVYKATELKNGSILKMESNVGATPRYYLNDKEITVMDYWFHLTEDNVEKNIEVIESAQKTTWTMFKSFLRMFKR